MTNVGELDRVRRDLREHPEHHDQRRWVCGTTACVAGRTVALHEGVATGENLDAVLDTSRTRSFYTPVGGRLRREFRWVAQGVLGLTEDEAEALFVSTANNCTGGRDDTLTAEQEALRLIDALIARDKGDATDDDRAVLRWYGLPTEPGGDAT